jgi:hypothetical protein
LSLAFPILAPILLDFGINKPKSIFYSNKKIQANHDYSSESSDEETDDRNKSPPTDR